MRILSLAPLSGPALEELRTLGELEIDPWIDHVPIKLHSADELRARLDGVEVLIVEADFVPAGVLDGSSLRVLGVCRGDPNNVDVAAATRNRIAVVRTPGRNAAAVAELTIGLMLALLRGIVAADDDVRAGRWVVDGKIAQQRYIGRELSACTVGLVGYGAVARAVAARLAAFGARAATYDPFARDVDVERVDDLGDLIAMSDIVSVHAPLTDATRGLLDAAAFARMRLGTLFVNTARYDIAAEEPLLAALADGTIAAAAFDHFHNEFLAPDHPLVSMPHVILTPHIGGATRQVADNHTREVLEGIRAVLGGTSSPLVVNPEVL